MEFCVHVLDVDEEEVTFSCHCPHLFFRTIERSIYGTMESAATEFLQQRDNVLHHGFTATQGHASPALSHHLTFLLHLVHDFTNAPFASTHLSRHRGADLCLEFIWLPSTTAAMDALTLLESQLWTWAPRLWIVTPDATQKTTLQEEGRPDAWSIVDGIAFDVKKNHTSSFSVRAMISF